MLSEAKDTSELMVDLGYASLFFADTRMADEVTELEERLGQYLRLERTVPPEHVPQTMSVAALGARVDPSMGLWRGRDEPIPRRPKGLAELNEGYVA